MRKKQQAMVPQAVQDQGGNRSEAPQGVLQRGREGKRTAAASAVVMAANKRKEAVASAMKRHPAAISVQKTKAMENKKKAGLVGAQVKEDAAVNSLQKTKTMEKKKKEAGLAVQRGKSAVKVAPEEKKIIILSDDDDDVKEEEEEEYSSSDEEGDSMDKDSDDSEFEEEELVAWQSLSMMADKVAKEKLAVHEQLPLQKPVVVEEADDGERGIVRVRKFEGSAMLAEVDRTNDNGVASRTRQCKVRKLQNSQLNHDGKDSKGTLSDPIDL